ncbi:hypothetical protein, partial [Noviherbaspirillum galbum]|uniref:hypothetical protein n=1 Tax=Noviherbaspirillum galbum TaxID=2709383 RepID=UPI001969AF52
MLKDNVSSEHCIPEMVPRKFISREKYFYGATGHMDRSALNCLQFNCVTINFTTANSADEKKPARGPVLS